MAGKQSMTSWASEASAHDDNRPAIAGFETIKLVREFVPVKGGGTSTMGELLDAHLRECAAQGSEVQSITLTFHEDQWPQYAQGIRGSI